MIVSYAVSDERTDYEGPCGRVMHLDRQETAMGFLGQRYFCYDADGDFVGYASSCASAAVFCETGEIVYIP